MERLNLSTMHLIVQIADHGSVTEAARRASLTVAAVSKRVVDLEAELDLPLFVRHARGMTPTMAGLALVAQARQMLFDVDKLQADLSELRAGRLGAVRLGANAAAMTQFLPEALARFHTENHEIRVDLTELTSDLIVARLLDGRLDIGLFADLETAVPFQVFPYKSYRLCVAMRQDCEFADRGNITFEEVCTLPVIALEGGSTIIKLLQRRSERPLDIAMQARSFDVVARFVQAGIGIGIMPEFTARLYAPAFNLSVVPLTDDWAHRTTLIGARPADSLTPAARLLFDLLRRPDTAQPGTSQANAVASRLTERAV